jgi:outer membrane protein TolC
MLQLKKSILLGFLIFLSTSWAQALTPTALTVDQFLNLAVQETEDFQAVDKSLKSLEYEIDARDLQLATNLQLDAFDTRDRKDVFNNFNRNSHSQLYGVTLSKPFSTGTNVSLGADYEIAETTATGNLYRADWEVALTQDLWRNGFGRSVRLRRQSDQMELENRKLNLILQRQQLMNTLENLYWDYALVQKELLIRQENLKRSEQILNWTNRRVKLSAARDTDLLQVQALFSSRKLELADIERLEVSTKNQMNQLVPSLATKSWAPTASELEKDRAIQSLVFGESRNGSPVLLATLAAKYLSQQLQVQAEVAQDNLNPVLQLQLAHSQNGIRSDSQEAVDRALGNSKTDANRIGLIFSMNLDMGLISQSRDSATLAAESAALTAQRLARTSELSWTDLQAEISYLKNSLQLSKDLYNFQKKNIESERRYFQQGRNTIFEFINFEIVAADAELRFFRVLNQMRKREGQARLYTFDQKASL